MTAPAIPPPTPADRQQAAARLADELAATLARLVVMRDTAERAIMPQGVVMGLHWLIEDAAATLDTLRTLAGTDRPAT